MPSLLVAICDQIVEGLDSKQRTIDRVLVERACQSEAVARTITAWRPRFGLQDPQLAALDQMGVGIVRVERGHGLAGQLGASLVVQALEPNHVAKGFAAGRGPGGVKQAQEPGQHERAAAISVKAGQSCELVSALGGVACGPGVGIVTQHDHFLSFGHRAELLQKRGERRRIG